VVSGALGRLRTGANEVSDGRFTVTNGRVSAGESVGFVITSGRVVFTKVVSGVGSTDVVAVVVAVVGCWTTFMGLVVVVVVDVVDEEDVELSATEVCT
jgi:hypothetical protein